MSSTIAVALLAGLLAQTKERNVSHIEENKQVVRRVFEEAVNQGKLELLNELIAEGYAGANSGLAVVGPAAFIAPLRALKEGFPDLRYQLDEVIAEGDRVAVRWKWTGTHRGTYRGPAGVYPPTGKTLTNEGMAVFEVKSGKLQRASVLTDRLGFLQEVGAIAKPPAATGSR